VFSLLEGAKLPLSQVSSYAPFATANPPAQLTTMWELYQSVPEFRAEWEQYNLVVLGLTGTDSYDLYTKDPVASFADLAGRKISAPGVLGTWLRGTGANAVDGALTTYYTDIQTGVSDGTLSLALGILPAKVYEVAPYVTRLNLGTVFSGAIAVNKDSWDGLPEEVQAAMTEAGQYYTAAHADDLLTRQEAALAAIDAAGGTIFELPADERAKWVDGLPNIAAEWVQAQDAAGRPGATFLAAYMDGLRTKGETPSRDWDKLD
jgi:TRAP-type transport system periplasmic protein